ncbi:MAG: hypothetical protein H6534_07180 [Chthonomonadaceae bacterium]|nr:hypothetical protein [Chthonomonadaceae bacterium]
MRTFGWPLAMLALVAGCASPAKPPPAAPTAQNPTEAAHEQYRAGVYSLSVAQESLATALDAVSTLRDQMPAGTEARESLSGVADSVDGAGANIANVSTEAPSLEAFESRFAEYDDRRLAAITAINDALHELRDAQGALADLAQSAKGMAAELDRLSQRLDGAESDLLSALEAFGGKDEGAGD